MQKHWGFSPESKRKLPPGQFDLEGFHDKQYGTMLDAFRRVMQAVRPVDESPKRPLREVVLWAQTSKSASVSTPLKTIVKVHTPDFINSGYERTSASTARGFMILQKSCYKDTWSSSVYDVRQAFSEAEAIPQGVAIADFRRTVMNTWLSSNLMPALLDLRSIVIDGANPELNPTVSLAHNPDQVPDLLKGLRAAVLAQSQAHLQPFDITIQQPDRLLQLS